MVSSIKTILFFLFIMLSAPTGYAKTWERHNENISEPALTCITSLHQTERSLFVSSAQQVYYRTDNNDLWSPSLAIPSSEETIHTITFDPLDTQCGIVATERSLWRTENAGTTWHGITAPLNDEQGEIIYTAHYGWHNTLFIGTSVGVWVSPDKGIHWKKLLISGIQQAVTAIASTPERVFLCTTNGIYSTDDPLNNRWDIALLFRNMTSHEEISDGHRSLPCGTISICAAEPKYIVASNGTVVYESLDSGINWRELPPLPIRSKSIQDILPVMSSENKTLFAATQSGLYLLCDTKPYWHVYTYGLSTQKISSLAYHVATSHIWGATMNGIYTIDIRDICADPTSSTIPTRDEITACIAHEPTIRQVQEMAIEYADVSPGKIREWKHAVKKSAWMPDLDIGADYDRDRNIDLDRGTSSTPDTYIIGPDESGFSFDISLSWDLGKFFWNDDVLSIDSRSKYTADFRQEILSEVTHLYFERRRVQYELLAMEDAHTAERLEKELFFERLTAQLDALTGGKFSDKVSTL